MPLGLLLVLLGEVAVPGGHDQSGHDERQDIAGILGLEDMVGTRDRDGSAGAELGPYLHE